MVTYRARKQDIRTAGMKHTVGLRHQQADGFRAMTHRGEQLLGWRAGQLRALWRDVLSGRADGMSVVFPFDELDCDLTIAAGFTSGAERPIVPLDVSETGFGIDPGLVIEFGWTL